MDLIRPELEKYLVKKTPEYVDYAGTEQLIRIAENTERPLLLIGPKGVGKTLSVAAYAKKNNIPLIQMDCSENTKRGDVLGRFVILDEVKFNLGLIPIAMEAANKYGKAILLIEEIANLPPNFQRTLNSLLDWRKYIIVPEINEKFELENGNKLIIVATTNPSYYGGTYEINEDLKSRFLIKYVDYPTTEQEKDIIQAQLGNVNQKILERAIVLSKELRNSEKSGQITYAPSPRDLVQLCSVFAYLKENMSDTQEALKTAIELTIYNKYSDEEERRYINGRIFSAFGIRMD